MKKIVISKCLGFAPCRYDGKILKLRWAADISGKVKFIPVCPEVEIGLGVPRKKIRLVRTARGVRLIQQSTGRDLTGKMRRFSRRFLKGTGKADEFILKGKSPSCGIGDVKIYQKANSRKPSARGTGIFAQEVLKTKGVKNVKRI